MQHEKPYHAGNTQHQIPNSGDTGRTDQLFLLLIFFMITASFSVQKSIQRPAQKDEDPSTNVVETPPEDNPDIVTVQVDEFNAYNVITTDSDRVVASKQDLIETTLDALDKYVPNIRDKVDLAKAELPADAAEDSFNMLPVWLGEQGDKPVRPYLLQQTMSLALSIRQGRWKLLDHRGSGGNNYERHEGLRLYALPELAPDAAGQLYDLDADPGETRNLYHEHPEIVASLRRTLEEAKSSGRSRQ